MTDQSRRDFLTAIAQVTAVSLVPASIRRALAIPAARIRGSIQDVRHVVILMQENRSFDHYFGTLRGVRGFGDRHPVPLVSGRPVWFQSDGSNEIPPYHLNTKTTSALRVPVTPHSFADAQAAWSQGRFGYWPKFKTAYSMGYYRREDIPFQYALADAFTVCDAYHCSVTTGTDPNRIVFWSGSNFNPERRARGENCNDADSEPDNLRCWIRGELPEPGYTYAGSAFRWPTIPDVLEKAGVSWRIYQNPNDNWTGAMHGCLAFESFRRAAPSSAIYRNGMTHWSLEQLSQDVKRGTLPQVSWVLPPEVWSEHPRSSSPAQGAEFTARVLDALTANPEIWASAVLFLTFDENDGLFDHVPPPAPPSHHIDGTVAGKSTLELRGEYFFDPKREHLHPADTDAGTTRPWGLGPRVPMYVVSPWSKGGWVDSQVFDHTSVGQFLEKRFGIEIPAISPWHRAVCGDLTSAFDFGRMSNRALPRLPDASGSERRVAEATTRPKPEPPTTPEKLYQESGVRLSRALGYELNVSARQAGDRSLTLQLTNSGKIGAVLHVYDRLRLGRIPHRYTVEAGKSLTDLLSTVIEERRYDLWVCGPNGFVRELVGEFASNSEEPEPIVDLAYDIVTRTLRLDVENPARAALHLTVHTNAYRTDESSKLQLAARGRAQHVLPLEAHHDWYDFTVRAEMFERRFAGRVETGSDGISDPANDVY